MTLKHPSQSQSSYLYENVDSLSKTVIITNSRLNYGILSAVCLATTIFLGSEGIQSFSAGAQTGLLVIIAVADLFMLGMMFFTLRLSLTPRLIATLSPNGIIVHNSMQNELSWTLIKSVIGKEPDKFSKYSLSEVVLLYPKDIEPTLNLTESGKYDQNVDRFSYPDNSIQIFTSGLNYRHTEIFKLIQQHFIFANNI